MKRTIPIRRLPALSLFLALLASPLVSATEQALSPDTVSVLAGVCANCHGPGGQSAGFIPSIADLPQNFIFERLMAFKEGTAADATVMTRLMKGYDDKQIEALAHWFSKDTP